jgi:uncharacterized protein (TIGR03083 family)
MVVRVVDLAEARELLTDSVGTMRDAVASVPPDRWDNPSVLEGWTVRDLMAHLARALTATTAAEPVVGRVVAQSIADFLGGYAASAAAIARATRVLAAQESAPPLDVIDDAWAQTSAHLDRLGPAGGVVVGRRGPIRLSDLVLTRLLEVVIHSDDIVRSLGAGPPLFSADVERAAVRTLLEVLAERQPGKAVEVRVPPYAAVQCVAGPRHTRGTPPNVVETDPWTWIRLAAGRDSWGTALESGTVTASGARSDLAPLLPLF